MRDGRAGKKVVGLEGEYEAELFLRRSGYRILSRNYITPLGEIDLVAMHRNVLVFVEVRTRSTAENGPPYSSITEKKKRHMTQSAAYYMQKHGGIAREARIDVISVIISPEYGPVRTEHLISAVWIE